MEHDDLPGKGASNDGLGPAHEPHPLVRRLDDMAAGWLCAGLPDADLPAEAAREIERLRHALAQSGKLAEDRLRQMKADRAHALRWRDQLGLNVKVEAPLTALRKDGNGTN